MLIPLPLTLIVKVLPLTLIVKVLPLTLIVKVLPLTLIVKVRNILFQAILFRLRYHLA